MNLVIVISLSLVLPHRTQIVYMTDISFVSTMLNLEPGVKMLECGTGSGSFSHSAARTIMPTGHLYSFEYHEDRGTKASLEFNAHGLDMITVECRDVCKVGFGLKSQVSAGTIIALTTRMIIITTILLSCSLFD